MLKTDLHSKFSSSLVLIDALNFLSIFFNFKTKFKCFFDIGVPTFPQPSPKIIIFFLPFEWNFDANFLKSDTCSINCREIKMCSFFSIRKDRLISKTCDGFLEI